MVFILFSFLMAMGVASEYINSPINPCNVCIGVPYGTSYWQVGDSTEQNGCFKMYLTHAKRDLLTKKTLYNLPYAIEKTDVVGIVSHAWDQSFATERTNQKAILDRGWGPLNYNALLHPEIQVTRNGGGIQRNEASKHSTMTPAELNLTEGIPEHRRPKLWSISREKMQEMEQMQMRIQRKGWKQHKPQWTSTKG